jgi:hypothetical protein
VVGLETGIADPHRNSRRADRYSYGDACVGGRCDAKRGAGEHQGPDGDFLEIIHLTYSFARRP